MATESNIFEMYCSKAILELEKAGIIRGDYDWDCFKGGMGITYTIRSVDESTGRPRFYLVIELKEKTIIVFDELSKKQKEYNYDPKTRNIDGFVEFLISFANDIQNMDDKSMDDQPKMVDMSMITLDQDHLDKHIDEEELKDLVESIKEVGFLSPILVRERDDQYVIIIGERRWRAAQIAGLTEIPVIVRNGMRDMSDIYERWVNMWKSKEDYAFGDIDIDLDSFKELVKDTYYLFKEMHGYIEANDYSKITPNEMSDYMGILTFISRYSASCCTDNSKDHAFALTRVMAFDLADLGANFSFFASRDEGVIISMEACNYGFEKEISYDVNKGDLSDYIEYAMRAGC